MRLGIGKEAKQFDISIVVNRILYRLFCKSFD